MSIDETANAVVAAARARAAALAAGDRRRLAALLRSRLRWTTYQGDVLDREQYLAASVGGDVTWVGQTLQDVDVKVVGDAVAVLTALVVDVSTAAGGRRRSTCD